MRNLELRISLIFLLVALNCGGTAPIQKDSASSPSNFSETGLYGYVRRGSVNVRLEGKLASDKIGMLKKSEVVKIESVSPAKEDIQNDSEYWYKIKSKSGLSGWVYGKFLMLYDHSPLTEKEYMALFVKKLYPGETMKKVAPGEYTVKSPYNFSFNVRISLEDGVIEVHRNAKEEFHAENVTEVYLLLKEYPKHIFSTSGYSTISVMNSNDCFASIVNGMRLKLFDKASEKKSNQTDGTHSVYMLSDGRDDDKSYEFVDGFLIQSSQYEDGKGMRPAQKFKIKNCKLVELK
ncbi:SH3 domain protein [Leptospira interrogans serovar Grippotyphosa str. 2006006986]|uniref:SH3 domain-containing protein n=1 Tax=Leptospira interrogans TaxID=173 RepID=UPI0002926C46|nr:SH3 domain-containing protein [Leptospira interrogans]EKO87922.1 SH3 domain protein [Leptospira interrogans serovar Grippotyphosa str. Andaman]EKP84873.1 SH3 domain protein [Leptospira interrogans serovar Grippotyphosa str. 2006006986]